MDAHIAFSVGQAVTYLLKKPPHSTRIIIGKDTRISGYMLEGSLESGITSMGGVAEMVGVLPCEIEMTGKPQGHGYVIAQVENENPFFTPGTVLRGHEFHNSRILRRTGLNGSVLSEDSLRLDGFTSKGRCDALASATAYRLSRGNGLGNGCDGILYRNVLASYTHLHSGGAPDWARGLVRRAQLYRDSYHREKL